ncbi:PREDICTED: translation machinery-associated protein 16 [Ceratosolen solmsi marchali]|uniref:Translation machinery-associated protein 16 n=1 Tax=Ceratosolen solmsi marchali TaxID=326594 RepID=A0AAJ6YMQ0_9HYME|nr:PREDICTED: translation machinery-associated protein 16 [Ceratosolen solmsi marchali]
MNELRPLKQTSERDEVKSSTKYLHPKSRKCIALIKQLKKKSKKVKAKQESRYKQTLLAEKLLWFQKNLNHEIHAYTAELISLLIEKYIARNDDELQQINIKRSIGGKRNQQHASREDAIRITKEREIRDYESCGIEIPNLLNPIQYELLKNWNGDLKLLPNFKLCHFKKYLDNEIIKEKK